MKKKLLIVATLFSVALFTTAIAQTPKCEKAKTECCQKAKNCDKAQKCDQKETCKKECPKAKGKCNKAAKTCPNAKK